MQNVYLKQLLYLKGISKRRKTKKVTEKATPKSEVNF